MSNQQSPSPVVTIDGPAASGKSSVSRELAQRFGWSWVSTGAFYRGIAYVALATGSNLEDEEAIAHIVKNEDWEVCMDPVRTQFVFKGEDVTDEIYKEEIGSAASKVSHHPKVRSSLLAMQRDCRNKVSGLVAEGRDCGTVVFPDAPVKIYLTAKSDSRAQRRAQEQGRSFEETKAAQKQRDQQDSSRQASPLQVPENAHVVDTSEMDLQQVVEHIDGLVRSTLSL